MAIVNAEESTRQRIDLSQVFKRVAVINLNRRQDRWREFMDRLPPSWPFVTPQRFPAIDGSLAPPPHWWRAGPGAWGCYRSHFRIVEQCLNDGVESVLILEDDALIADDFKVQAQLFFDHLPDDWSFIYLGGQHIQLDMGLPQKVNDWVYKPFNVNRLHAVGFRGKEMLLKVYRHLNSFRNWIPEQHIDHHLGEFHKRGESGIYTPRQWIVGQCDGQSNICGKQLPDRFFNSADSVLSPRVDLPSVAVLGVQGGGGDIVAGELHRRGLNLGSQFVTRPRLQPDGTFEAIRLSGICERLFDPETLQPKTDFSNRVAHLRLWGGDRSALLRDSEPCFAGYHPMLCLLGPELLQAWKDVRFVVVQRDIDEIWTALASSGWGRSKSETIGQIEKLFHARSRFLDSHDVNQIVVRFDQLIDDRDGTLDRVASFLELDRAAPALDQENQQQVAELITGADDDQHNDDSSGGITQEITSDFSDPPLRSK